MSDPVAPPLIEMPLPSEGGCRCDSLRFRLTAPPLITAICHCTGCQKMSGSAFSTTIVMPAAGFQVFAGKAVFGGMRAPGLHHYHCPDCLSWAFTRVPGMDHFVNVRATLLDDPQWFTPFIETVTSEKLPWATVTAPHGFEKFPEFAAFEGLIAAYASCLGRKEKQDG